MVLSSIKTVFWNATDRRLRLPWRFVVAGIVLGIVSLVVAFSLRPVWVSAFVGFQFASFGRLGTLLFQTSLELVVVVLFTYLVGRFIDRRRFADFGFHLSGTWWLDFGFGLALGATLMTAIFLTELALGWVRVTGFFRTVSGLSFVTVFLTSVLVFVVVGVSEELLMRGYLLTNLAEGFRCRPGGSAPVLRRTRGPVLERPPVADPTRRGGLQPLSRRHSSPRALATTSISTPMSMGKSSTCTALRAGYGAEKCSAYTSFISS
ncbi:hypothetical protein [Haladaptatus sp. W1]|uniref:hypothetical protein n=1 Tax=Haladaptatus sp. W1 TaxID=1897478 RepID=UPI000A9CA06C|nr:hypothetical protein [Haladaptatus sp. W1]